MNGNSKKKCAALVMGLWIACFSNVLAAADAEVLKIPEGNEERGRQVFQMFNCNACHRIAGDPELKNAIATQPGPVLGLKQSAYKARFLAQSIIDPSHVITPGFTDKENPGQSRMGNFAELMTVQQLSDLVAYLKLRDEEV